MKRILLSIVIVIVLGSVQAFSQCTPNTSITSPGIYPDSATGLTPAVAGQAYSEVMQIRVPADTLGFPIISIQLTSFTGLPAGVTYACNPANCTFPGGSNGCVLISGTPSTPGTYPVTAIVVTTASVLGNLITQTDTLTYYNLVVTGSGVGLQQLADLRFSLNANMPNPYSDFCSIRFSVPERTSVEFRLYNMIGKEVYSKFIDAEAGVNNLRFDGRDFSAGIYMYAMTYGSETITKRMVISRNK